MCQLDPNSRILLHSSRILGNPALFSHNLIYIVIFEIPVHRFFQTLIQNIFEISKTPIKAEGAFFGLFYLGQTLLSLENI